MRLIALLITILFGAFYASIEVFKRKYNIPSEYTRKIAHLFSGIGSLLASHFLSKGEFLSIACLFLLLFSVLYLKKKAQFLQIKTRRTYGEITFPLGLITLAYFLYSEKQLFMYGILTLALPDVLAGLTGYYIGSKKKTFWGSLVYLFSAAVLLFTGFNLMQALILAFFLTIVEYLTPYGFDNLSVPVGYILVVGLLF